MKKVVDNSKDIVKSKDYQLQSNDISNGIYSCSAIARKLIAFCISNAYDDEIELTNVFADEELTEHARIPCKKSSFSFSNFYTRMKIAKGGRSNKLIEEAVDECMRAIIKVEQTDILTHKRKWFAYSWFVESYFDEKAEKINMTFNPLIYKAIVEWYFTNKGYSALSLELLGQLSSFYSMRYYEMALSQMGNKGKNGNEQGEWFFEKSIAELKTMFELQERKSYDRPENFIAYVVEKPIMQLNEKNKEFQIEVVKIKEGRKTVGFRFVCIATNEKQWKIAKSDTYEEKQAKAEINKLENEITFFKDGFSNKWKIAEERIQGQQTFPMFEISKNEMILQELKKMLAEESETRKRK